MIRLVLICWLTLDNKHKVRDCLNKWLQMAESKNIHYI